MDTYESLLGHVRHHDIRRMLLRGCESSSGLLMMKRSLADGCMEEDARTIGAAIKDMTDEEFNRRIARFLDIRGTLVLMPRDHLDRRFAGMLARGKIWEQPK